MPYTVASPSPVRHQLEDAGEVCSELGCDQTAGLVEQLLQRNLRQRELADPRDGLLLRQAHPQLFARRNCAAKRVQDHGVARRDPAEQAHDLLATRSLLVLFDFLRDFSRLVERRARGGSSQLLLSRRHGR